MGRKSRRKTPANTATTPPAFHPTLSEVRNVVLSVGGLGTVGLGAWGATDPTAHLWSNVWFLFFFCLFAVIAAFGVFAWIAPLFGWIPPKPKPENRVKFLAAIAVGLLFCGIATGVIAHWTKTSSPACFAAHIYRFSIAGKLDDERKPHYAAFIYVSVTNSGSVESTLSDFTLEIKTKDGQEIPASVAEFPQAVNDLIYSQRPGKPSPTQRITDAEMLWNKTAERPIKPGGQAFGLLAFELHSSSNVVDAVDLKSAKVSFRDVATGHSWGSEMRATASTEVGRFPGEPPILVPAPAVKPK